MNPVLITLLATANVELAAVLMKHVSGQLTDAQTLAEVVRIVKLLEAALATVSA